VNRAVFLDRDGTINEDVPYCSSPDDLRLIPGAADGIKLLNKHGFKVIIVTNQSGIARGYFTEEVLTSIHDKLRRELAAHEAYVDAIYYCGHHPDNGCDCRKPKPKMVFQAASDFNLDLSQSYVIGDSQMDIEMGITAGCKTILVGQERTNKKSNSSLVKPDYITPDVIKAAHLIIAETDNSAEKP